MTTDTIGQINGIVILNARCIPVAPSIVAASSRSDRWHKHCRLIETTLSQPMNFMLEDTPSQFVKLYYTAYIIGYIKNIMNNINPPIETKKGCTTHARVNATSYSYTIEQLLRLELFEYLLPLAQV